MLQLHGAVTKRPVPKEIDMDSTQGGTQQSWKCLQELYAAAPRSSHQETCPKRKPSKTSTSSSSSSSSSTTTTFSSSSSQLPRRTNDSQRKFSENSPTNCCFECLVRERNIVGPFCEVTAKNLNVVVDFQVKASCALPVLDAPLPQHFAKTVATYGSPQPYQL